MGFDVDLSNALAEKLGLTCEWLPNQAFDTLVPTIQQGGKADISIAGMTISDERLEQVDFSDPYLNSNQGIVAAAGSDLNSESLNAEGMQFACRPAPPATSGSPRTCPTPPRCRLPTSRPPSWASPRASTTPWSSTCPSPRT